MMDVLALIELMTKLVGAVTTVLPQIEQNIAGAKVALGSNDAAALETRIGQLHADSLALTARLDALKDKAVS